MSIVFEQGETADASVIYTSMERLGIIMKLESRRCGLSERDLYLRRGLTRTEVEGIMKGRDCHIMTFFKTCHLLHMDPVAAIQLATDEKAFNEATGIARRAGFI